jgi:hypothetical protein
LPVLDHEPANIDSRASWLQHGSHAFSRPERRPVKQIRRLNPKSTFVKSPSHLMDLDPDFPLNVQAAIPTPSPAASDSDLRPCHICHSAPKRRKDLENYLQCQKCEHRACYICARECSRGCRKQLCSKCCVEVGEEGDTWCLECYGKTGS